MLKRLRLPDTPTFKRPADLVYASDERPPATTLVGLAVQHAAAALALLAYTLAAAQIGALDAEATRSMVTATILGMAIATFLQAWGKRVGSGLMLVHIPDPLLVVVSGMVAAQYGVGGLVMVGLVNAAIALGASQIVPRLRAVLPPTVAGVVICVAGLSLIKPGITQTANLDALGIPVPADLLIGTTTLMVVVFLSIWGNKRAKLLALLLGLGCGLVLAGFMDRLTGLDALRAAPIFGLPTLPIPTADIDIGILVAVGLLALMAQLDTFGSVVLMHKMNEADWRRPNMRLIAGGMRASALGNLCAAWFGAHPTATSSANIALCHISRSTSRWIGFMTALLLGLFAFLPQLTLALTLIPTPIIGAISLYAAAYLIVSGIELIASRALDSHGIFVVGLSFIGGIAMMLMPQLADNAPVSLRFLVSNGVIVAGLTAITLNLLFRIGISQRARQALTHDGTTPVSEQIVNFVESNGARWSARREAVRQAAAAALEAAEAIQGSGHGRHLIEIRGRFDEFNLDIDLLHHGPALPLQTDVAPELGNLLDLDDAEFTRALDDRLDKLPQILLRRLADRLSSGTDKNHSWLKLHFDH
ncbi:hypothetical protein KVP09_06435 [Alcaligenaceae bacterium CGII-47]|nr:hypothetical protein [Alcaligenaceae bacterium CGII-47]